MALKRNSWRTQKNTSLSAILSTINPKQSARKLHICVHGNRRFVECTYSNLTSYIRLCYLYIRQSNPITGLDRSWGFQKFEAPRFQDNLHMKVARLSALRNGRFYPQGNIPATHFCYRLSQPHDHSTVGMIMSMKNSNDTIGNRTRDLPVCREVPQPTALVTYTYTIKIHYEVGKKI